MLAVNPWIALAICSVALLAFFTVGFGGLIALPLLVILVGEILGSIALLIARSREAEAVLVSLLSG